MEYTTKLMYQSNYWYNDGLKKANIRDLSGAITSLRRSLQYNRSNIAARNLLGLVYYGRGDVVEALVEWIISKNFQSGDNIANYYIDKIQEVPGELENINQAVKKFNQSLDFARKKGEDLAIIQLKKVVASHPDYVKAHQLLALLYIQTEQYTSARQELRIAHRLDTTDEITLQYMHEITRISKERALVPRGTEKGKESQTVTYNIGNETIIQPLSSTYKEHTLIHTIINIAVGVAVGVAVMWFLIMPAVNSSRQARLNEQTVEFSDKIATQEAQISALKTELDTYRASSEATENVQATASSTKDSYEIVLEMAIHMAEEDMSDQDMLDEMLKVDPDSLGEYGKDRYDTITEALFPRMCDRLYNAASEDYENGDYESVITALEQVVAMDENYNEGEGRLLLARAYEKSGEQDKANLEYQKIIENLEDTDAADAAKEALDAQNRDDSDQPEDGENDVDNPDDEEE